MLVFGKHVRRHDNSPKITYDLVARSLRASHRCLFIALIYCTLIWLFISNSDSLFPPSSPLLFSGIGAHLYFMLNTRIFGKTFFSSLFVFFLLGSLSENGIWDFGSRWPNVEQEQNTGERDRKKLHTMHPKYYTNAHTHTHFNWNRVWVWADLCVRINFVLVIRHYSVFCAVCCYFFSLCFLLALFNNDIEKEKKL